MSTTTSEKKLELDFSGLDAGAIDARCVELWESNAELRREFGELSVLQAYARAQAGGHIRNLGHSSKSTMRLDFTDCNHGVLGVDDTTIESRCRDLWGKHAELRAEFGQLDNLIAFARAQAANPKL